MASAQEHNLEQLLLPSANPEKFDDDCCDISEAKKGFKTNRKDKSRINAQSRRTTHAHLLKELGTLLPFPERVIQQIDYNSILRLVLCYFRMKESGNAIEDGSRIPSQLVPTQDLLMEALDGFLMVMLMDGTIVYLSDNIHKYLGLFQSEYIGANVFDLIWAEDHQDVKDALKEAEVKNMSGLGKKDTTCSFFCRMKCPKFKMAMCAAKTPGYKLMYISGQYKMIGNEPRLLATVRPVSPPSILEIRMEGNMFVTHYKLDMRCTFFDGRLQNLLGYTKPDMVGTLAFDLHHHEDLAPCQECHAGLLKRGEGVSGYYRMLAKNGQFIWCQTRAQMMFDSRSGRPSYIVCMNFIISREDGEKSLAQRSITAATPTEKVDKPVGTESMLRNAPDHSFDPFPVTNNEWAGRDPFDVAEGKNAIADKGKTPDDSCVDSLKGSDRQPSQRKITPPGVMRTAGIPQSTDNRTPSPLESTSSLSSIDTPSPPLLMSHPSKANSTQSPLVNNSTAASVDTVFSPYSHSSISSVESGYNSGMSTSSPVPQDAGLADKDCASANTPLQQQHNPLLSHTSVAASSHNLGISNPMTGTHRGYRHQGQQQWTPLPVQTQLQMQPQPTSFMPMQAHRSAQSNGQFSYDPRRQHQLPEMPATNTNGMQIKQEGYFQPRPCFAAGNSRKRTYAPTLPAVGPQESQKLSNPATNGINPGAGYNSTGTSILTQIPIPAASFPLTELKSEDLNILDVPFMPEIPSLSHSQLPPNQMMPGWSTAPSAGAVPTMQQCRNYTPNPMPFRHQ